MDCQIEINNMKKIILFIAVAMMTVTGVKAQSDSKHEIAVSYGALANSEWLDIIENMIGAILVKHIRMTYSLGLSAWSISIMSSLGLAWVL